MVKTDFGLELQGYIIPEAMGASISKYPTKIFTKSTVSVIGELIVEDIEHDRPRHKINKVGDGGEGVGYDRIGDDIID